MSNPYRNKISEFPGYILECPLSGVLPLPQQQQLQEKITAFSDVFLEFGSGSGAHLIHQAKQLPSALFVGFEIRFKRAVRTIEKALEQKLDNILILRTRAEHAPFMFKPSSISGVFVNFPDPWDKRRWLKNRLLNQIFLSKLNLLLKDQAFLSYKTDHREYFESTLALLKMVENFEIRESSSDLHASEFANFNVKTEFEHIFASQKLPVHYLKARKSVQNNVSVHGPP